MTAVLPTIEVRFPATYAWLTMIFGVIFFLLSFLVAGQNTGLGLFIAALSLAAVIGANYWRHHLHVVARMTPRQLILRRGGTVDWADIAAIDKKTIRVRGQHEYICIRLSKARPAPPGLEGFMQKVKKAALGGYDIIVPDGELSCTADWFIAECDKRRAALTGRPE